MSLNDETGDIVCDAQGCETIAPSDIPLLIKHNGLQGLGWKCTGGKHFCPEHSYE